MRSPAPPDVLVVGGGVIGLSVAWQAAVTGRRVAVVDPAPGRGATWAAAGMLAPVGEANFGEDGLSLLLVRAAGAWPGFAADLETASGLAVGYRPDGTLLVAVDPSDRSAVDDLLAYRRGLGLEASPLTPAACRAAEPLLSPAIGGGADLVGDHQVDNRRLVDALLAALERAGVELVRTRVTGLRQSNQRVEGVDLDDGTRLPAPTVVVAAGCWSGQIAGWAGATCPPVRPVKGLTLRLGAPSRGARLARAVRGLVHGRSCYLVPRDDGSLVVGATVEERGFDLVVEAGSVGDLLDDARRLIPSIEGYELVETSTGLRPGSPDNGPMVGVCGLAGLVVATGHYRNGVLLAPLTALEVCRILDAGAASHADDEASPFAPFRPDRFLRHGGATPGAPDRITGWVGRPSVPT